MTKESGLGRDCVSAELLSVCCSEHSKVEAVIVVAVARGSPAPSSAAARRHRDGAIQETGILRTPRKLAREGGGGKRCQSSYFLMV